MRFLKAFGQSWYEFIIGDDPKIAVAVVAALAVLLGAMKAHLFADHGLAVLGAIVVVTFFTVSLAIDVRPKKPKR